MTHRLMSKTPLGEEDMALNERECAMITVNDGTDIALLIPVANFEMQNAARFVIACGMRGKEDAAFYASQLEWFQQFMTPKN